MNPSDTEIINRVQSGDRDAYLVLFERYYSRVESYARRRMQNAEGARDIASETFLRAYRHVDRFRTEENITYLGYLLLICRRLMTTDQVRRQAAPCQSIEDVVGEAERLADASALPESLLLDTERRMMLQEAMGLLPPDDREIIHLAFERDLSRRDMVEILNKPSVSAVTSHLYRAVQKLKAIVIAQGYFAAECDRSRN